MGALAIFLGFSQADGAQRVGEMKRVKGAVAESAPLEINLLVKTGEEWRCPIPDIQHQLIFSFDPPRPERSEPALQVSVRLKQSLASRKFVVPCRINLAYSSGVLTFVDEPSLFWMELEKDAEELIATVFVNDAAGEPFVAAIEPSPIRTAKEFSEGSAFRVLAEGRWWGEDLCHPLQFPQKISHRIDLGSPMESKLLDLEEEKWIVFKEGHWEVVSELKSEAESPIARILSATGSGLEIEGWEGNCHVRLLLQSTQLNPFKVKAEELFGSIRVRSDKQISCTLGKQCLILKVGDWVVKTDDRWKIIRKAEEKDAFLKGKIVGELFVLDEISHKQGQKCILGHMYNLTRTQKVQIHLPAASKSSLSARSKPLESKGKVR